MVSCGFWVLVDLKLLIGLIPKMQVCTIICTNKYGTSAIQFSSTANVKLEPSDDNVFVLLNYSDDICDVVDLSYTLPLPLPFHNTRYVLSQLCVDSP